ncbi:MAG TPA: NepR family anti-sigma factor [Afifellaceae bacterium]|nr:NepR family anti-sigma factor [Afifellaceae bacterium]
MRLELSGGNGVNREKFVKSKRLNQSDKMRASNSQATAFRAGSTRRGKKDWIGEQFKRIYDATAQEPVPDDMQKLLDALDELEGTEGRSSSADDE